MLNDTEKNYLKWFKKANEDELSVKSILDDRDGAPSTVCFLSQQIAEKYLKGLLVFFNKEFPKMHDLIDLEELILTFDQDIKEFEKDLDFLNRFYIESRYPGDYPEFNWNDAEGAYKGAKRIKEFVLNKIK